MKLDEAVLGVFMFRIILTDCSLSVRRDFIYADEFWVKFNFMRY